MKAIRIVVVTFVFAAISGIAVQSEKSIIQMVAVVASGIVGAAMSSAYELIDSHGQGIVTWFKSRIVYRRKEIYLSFSYLYRIEVEGKYLLVRGHRMRDRYQPIGGVYKFYPEARDFLNRIHAIPETSFVNHKESDDLRIRIKGEYLLAFYTWFLEMKDREYDPCREFYEELITPGYLPEESFRPLRYRKVGVHNKGITKSVIPGRIPEVVYADIFEVNLEDRQKELIKTAVMKHPDELCLVTPDEMKRRQHAGSVEMNLGNNVIWLLGEE